MAAATAPVIAPASPRSAALWLGLASYGGLLAWLVAFAVQSLEKPQPSDDDADRRLPMLTAAALAAQLATGLLLLWLSASVERSLLQSRWRHCHGATALCGRVAGAGAALTGLGFVAAGWGLEDAAAPSTSSDDSRPLRCTDDGVLLFVGLAMLVAAGLSLIATFWPSQLPVSVTDGARNRAAGAARSTETSFTDDEFHLLAGNFDSADEEWPRSMVAGLAQDPCRSALDLFDEGSGLTEPLLADEPPGHSGGPTHDSEEDHDSNMEASDNAPGRLRGTRRLLQLARPQVRYLYLGCAVLLVRLPCSLAIPHFVATALAALARGDFGAARREIVSLFVAGTVDALLDFWCVFLFGYANQRIVRDLRVGLFRHLLRQEVAFFDVHSSGALSSRLSSDCSEMGGDLTWFFRFSIESAVRIAGIAAYMLARCPRLGLCAVSLAPLVAAVNRAYGRWLAANAERVQTALAEANAAAQEALASLRTVVAFAAERCETERYEGKIQCHYRLNVRQLYMTGLYYMAVSTFLINTVVQALLLFVGSRLIYRHRLTAEVLLAFMLYQGQLQQELLNLFQSYSSLVKSSGAGDKVFALLDRRPPPPATSCDTVIAHVEEPFDEDDDSENDSDLETGRVSRPLSRSVHSFTVALKNVSFSYPSRPETKVLCDINLTIPRGKTLALVGKSGCGKSSIVNLLQRFYDPTSGEILINGQDLRTMDLLEYRRNIGVVTQEPVLFQGSILDNILYGKPHATRQEAVQAAKLANADTFIRQFPSGYETDVGERGSLLSGGQKQRIAIARAIIKKPALLLLDEATSALDSEAEKEVQDALDKLLLSTTDQTITTLVIAHRLQTVRHADCIAVLHQSHVKELGTHDELMAKEAGWYRRMVERAETTDLLSEAEYVQ